MGVTRQNHQLMLPFTEVEAGEARGNRPSLVRRAICLGRHITDRTAVYGPVRTVVWEGPGRKARPYPDPSDLSLGKRGSKGSPSPVGTDGGTLSLNRPCGTYDTLRTTANPGMNARAILILSLRDEHRDCRRRALNPSEYASLGHARDGRPFQCSPPETVDSRALTHPGDPGTAICGLCPDLRVRRWRGKDATVMVWRYGPRFARRSFSRSSFSNRGASSGPPRSG